jgi:hypothetical protein
MSGEPSLHELIEQLKRIRIQEARIIEQIEQTSIREERTRRSERTRPPTRVDGDWLPVDFQIGDRVRITNNVKAGQTATATVTNKINDSRISILTDDGSYTWRVRKNLIRL